MVPVLTYRKTLPKEKKRPQSNHIDSEDTQFIYPPFLILGTVAILECGFP